MPYDEDLANRLRELLADEDNITEKKMFGGLAFLLNGHMSVSASGRAACSSGSTRPETDAALKREPRRADGDGRAVDGRLAARGAEGVRTKRQLQPWVKRSVTFVKTLPPKSNGRAPARLGPALGAGGGRWCGLAVVGAVVVAAAAAAVVVARLGLAGAERGSTFEACQWPLTRRDGEPRRCGRS
jgi:hypothetical protein